MRSRSFSVVPFRARDACGPHRAGRDAAVAGAEVDPVADLGGAGLPQVKADPAEPGAGGGVLGDGLGPPPLSQLAMASWRTKTAACSIR